MAVTDLLGHEVYVGDRVVAAFREGNTGELRIGRVLSFGKRGGNETVVVEWNMSSPGRKLTVKSSIEAYHKRFIKIGG